jgi:hypothetical protein
MVIMDTLLQVYPRYWLQIHVKPIRFDSAGILPRILLQTLSIFVLGARIQQSYVIHCMSTTNPLFLATRCTVQLVIN